MTIQENYPLAPLTTFRIGGNADFFASVESQPELLEALDFAKSKNLAVLILGGGSNVLISDSGFRGLVIQNKISGTEFLDQGDNVEIKVGAGEVWDKVVKTAVGKKLWGIENLSNIPGLTGAIPIQNVGAYGQEASQVVASLEALDLQDNQIKTFETEDCGFGYRTSHFNTDWKGKFVILSVTFRLGRTSKPNISYVDVRKYFEAVNNRNPSLAEIRQAVIEIRKDKFPDLSQMGTAGSFFKNLILSHQMYDILAERIKINFDEATEKRLVELKNKFPTKNGIKIPSAFLVEICGLKGQQVGGAKLWEKQALVIVNMGDATSIDVIGLFTRVCDKVYSKTGMTLEAEPEFIGF